MTQTRKRILANQGYSPIAQTEKLENLRGFNKIDKITVDKSLSQANNNLSSLNEEDEDFEIKTLEDRGRWSYYHRTPTRTLRSCLVGNNEEILLLNSWFNSYREINFYGTYLIYLWGLWKEN